MPVNDLRPSPHISAAALLTLTGNFTPSICTALSDSLPCLLFFVCFVCFVSFQIHLVFQSVPGASLEGGDGKSLGVFVLMNRLRSRSGRSKNKENKADGSGTSLPVNQQHIITRSPRPFRSAEGLQFIPSRRITVTRMNDLAWPRWRVTQRPLCSHSTVLLHDSLPLK